jgi:hypothetical protein
LYPNNLACFTLNLFRQTKFETENFIIDLPKFYWSGRKSEKSASVIYFLGTPAKLNGDKVSPAIILEKYDDDRLKASMELCDKLFIKSCRTINGKEADVYQCEGSKDNYSALYVVRNNEMLITYTHKAHIFKRQYEVFFENVRLKDDKLEKALTTGAENE